MKIEQKLKKIATIGIEVIMSVSDGAKLSGLERYEQVVEHGFSIELDAKFYENGELVQAALFCLQPHVYTWPIGWDRHYKDKILIKSEIEKAIIASAFLSSEADRLLQKP